MEVRKICMISIINAACMSFASFRHVGDGPVSVDFPTGYFERAASFLGLSQTLSGIKAEEARLMPQDNLLVTSNEHPRASCSWNMKRSEIRVLLSFRRA